MDLFAITISIMGLIGKSHVVLADQAHDEASSSRVELRFPLGTKPEEAFTDREEQIIRGTRVPCSRQPWSLSTGADVHIAFPVASQRAWEGREWLEHHVGSRTPIRR